MNLFSFWVKKMVLNIQDIYNRKVSSYSIIKLLHYSVRIHVKPLERYGCKACLAFFKLITTEANNTVYTVLL